MNRLKITALLLVLGASLALAQHRDHHRGGMMKEKMARLDSVVTLTDAQKQEITELNKAFKAKMKEQRSSGERDHEAMKAMRKEHRQQIEAVLTPDQLAKLEAFKAERKESRKAMHAEIKEYRKTNMKPALQQKRAEFDNVLTADEKATIDALRAELKGMKGEKGEGKRHMDSEKRKALKARMDAALKPIVEAHKAELEQVHTDLKPLRETWKADLQAIKAKYDMDHKQSKGKKMGKKGKGQGDRHQQMMAYRFLLMKTSA
jgi:Spy/CpxP family protein refolding chaperone